MLIGINGKIGSGKDTLADIITKHNPEFVKKSYAYKLKLIASILIGCEVDDLMSQEGKNLHSDVFDLTYGEVLQRVGTNALRENFDKEVWIKSTFVDFEEDSNWIITDVRFENEAQSILDMGGTLIRILGDPIGTRANSKRNMEHSSETALDDWTEWHYEIQNNGTLEDLEEEATKVLQMTKDSGIYKTKT